MRRHALIAGSVGLGLLGLFMYASAQPGSSNGSTPANASQAIDAGKQTFRHDTFGDEVFWGDLLRLHEAIAGRRFGGVGDGLSAQTALAAGLKVDVDALPATLRGALSAGQVDLTDPATTLALLQLDAVVGLKGFFDERGNIERIGITCALCHSTVDDSFAPGIGHRLDGWANRDLNVGLIVSLAPNLQPIADRLHTDVATVREVFASWGPGKYDAILLHDGKAFRPDGMSGSVLLPPAFGFAGINLHTYTGWGSVPYWNAYVAVTQMHGQGTFYDPRLNDPNKFPLAVETGDWNVRAAPDLVTPKLAELHSYQLSLAPPAPPAGSFDEQAAARGQELFGDRARCATCHVPPLFTEPGWNMHAASDIGIDDFQAQRSPDGKYRTTPLRGLWTHQKGGFYHDGRFASLLDVVNHYDSFLSLGLSEQEKNDIVEYLKSL